MGTGCSAELAVDNVKLRVNQEMLRDDLPHHERVNHACREAVRLYGHRQEHRNRNDIKRVLQDLAAVIDDDEARAAAQCGVHDALEPEEVEEVKPTSQVNVVVQVDSEPNEKKAEEK